MTSRHSPSGERHLRRPSSTGSAGPSPLVGVWVVGRMLSVVSGLPLWWWAGRLDCSFLGSVTPSGADGSLPASIVGCVHFPYGSICWARLGNPVFAGPSLWEGFGPVFGQALGPRLPAAVFNAGFTPAACRGWFLSADIFGWRNSETNINCTTNVAVIIYGGQDGRSAEGGAEPIGLD